MNSKRIGLIPGSFKPYHAGHDALVRLASSENDEVLVFASTADRPRKGELSIQGDKMRIVMEKFVKPSLRLLGNVEVIYADPPVTPVTMVFNTLNRAEKNYSYDVHTIYSDSEDISRFTPVNLRKQAPKLFDSGQIIRMGIKRGSKTPNVSGTDMRRFIALNDVEMFSRMLPKSIQDKCHEILRIL
jgi:cytidyltransferase-like protein